MIESDNNQPATKNDLTELKTGLNQKIDSVEQKLTDKIDSVEQELTDKIDSVEQKLTDKINSVEGRVSNLETITKNIAIDLAKTQSDVRDIKHDMATKMATKDDISRIMNAIDQFSSEYISYRNKDTLRGDAIMRHEKQIANHEKRISSLEGKPR